MSNNNAHTKLEKYTRTSTSTYIDDSRLPYISSCFIFTKNQTERFSIMQTSDRSELLVINREDHFHMLDTVPQFSIY